MDSNGGKEVSEEKLQEDARIMQQQKEILNQMKEKVQDLAGDECFFSRQLLKENGLSNDAIFNYIYYSDDFLDSVTIQEAIGAIPQEEKRFRYKRKITLINRSPMMAKMRRGVYDLREILDRIEQYLMILRERDNYMPIKNVAKELNIKQCTVKRRMAANNIPTLYGKFIKKKDIETIKSKKLTIKKAAQQLGVSRWTLQRHAKKAGLKLNWGITEEKLTEIRQYIKIPNHEVAGNLKIKKQQFEKIAKELGIKTYGGYISIPEMKKIMQAVNCEK